MHRARFPGGDVGVRARAITRRCLSTSQHTSGGSVSDGGVGGESEQRDYDLSRDRRSPVTPHETQARDNVDGGREGLSADGKNVCALPNETPPQQNTICTRRPTEPHRVPCVLRDPQTSHRRQTESGWHAPGALVLSNGNLAGGRHADTVSAAYHAARSSQPSIVRTPLLSPVSPSALRSPLSHARFFECRRYNAVQPRGADRFFFFSLSRRVNLCNER